MRDCVSCVIHKTTDVFPSNLGSLYWLVLVCISVCLSVERTGYYYRGKAGIRCTDDREVYSSLSFRDWMLSIISSATSTWTQTTGSNRVLNFANWCRGGSCKKSVSNLHPWASSPPHKIFDEDVLTREIIYGVTRCLSLGNVMLISLHITRYRYWGSLNELYLVPTLRVEINVNWILKDWYFN